MRKKLKAHDEERMKFTGVFERIGYKPGYEGRASTMTVLLNDIRNENGKRMTTHAWLNYTKKFQELNLSMGDKIKFCARVKKYKKGKSENLDYKLSHPSKIKKVDKTPSAVILVRKETKELNDILKKVFKKGKLKV